MIAVARMRGRASDLHDAGQPRRWRRSSFCLPTDLAETGVPPLTNGIEGTPEAGFPDEIAPLAADYVFLKRRPGAFLRHRRVQDLLHMLRRDTIIIGGGATNRGVETSVREAFSMDLATIVVRDCCWSSDAAHARSLDKAMKMSRAYPAAGRVCRNVAGITRHCRASAERR